MIGNFTMRPTRRLSALLIATLLASPVAAETFDCVIVPAVSVGVGSPVSGLLEEVFVDQGDLVTAGQTIATLRSEVERKTLELLEVQANSKAEIEAQQSRLLLSQKRLERIQDLVERQVTPLEQLEAAEAEVEVIKREKSIAEMRRRVAGLELERARAQLDQRVIHSPIDGVIVARHLFDGEFLYAEAVVVTIAQIDPLHVEAYLPVGYYGSITVGTTVKVIPGEPVKGEFDATVEVVDRVFDAASGTFGLRLAMPNTDLAIPAGHRCQLDLALAGQ